MKKLLGLALVSLAAACSGPARTPVSEMSAGGGQTDDRASETRPRESGQQAKPEPKPDAKPEPKPATEKPADVKRGKLEDPEEEEQKRALAIIERVTGQKFLKAIPVYVYTPEELAEEMKDWGGNFVPENILGFYKPSTKAFYLVPKAAGNKRSFGLRVHEATHALQDQLYDLAKLHESVKTSDQDNALTALIEGHAVQVMIDGLSDLSPHVARIADVTVPTDKHNPAAWHTVFYYAMGAKFIQALKVKGGYAEVDRAFKARPVSSEQVLHPEKFTTETELPDVIEPDVAAINAALPEGWKLEGQDTLGEWATRMVFISEPKTFERAEALAAGWGGDMELAFSHPRKNKVSLKLWITTWDSEAEAEEFHAALSDLPDVRLAKREKRRVVVVRCDDELDVSSAEALSAAGAKSKITYDPAK